METPSPATLIRDADGALFYLPAGEIDRYRVPEDTATDVNEKLAAVATEATDADDAEVSGFNFTSRLSPSSLGLASLEPKTALVNDPVRVVSSSIPGDAFFPGSHFFPGNTL